MPFFFSLHPLKLVLFHNGWSVDTLQPKRLGTIRNVCRSAELLVFFDSCNVVFALASGYLLAVVIFAPVFFCLDKRVQKSTSKELENLAVAVVAQKVGEVLSDAVERFRENAKLR